MFAYTVASKLLTYPTQLASLSGRDLLFPALLDFAVTGVIIWAVAYMCSRTKKTFFGMVADTFGGVFSRIVACLFALFFLFCALFPILEQKQYVHAIFYDTVPSLIVFLPFFAFSVYAACKDFLNIGRCADICFPIFAIAIFCILIMSFGEVRLDNLLPVLKTGAGGIFKGARYSLFRFTEPAYMLFFVGRFDYKKGDAAKITLSYAAAGALTIITLAAFYGIYSGLAVDTQFAISKLSLYFPAINVVGRVDLVALYALEIVQLFALALNIQLAVYCIKTCIYMRDFKKEGKYFAPVCSLSVNAVLFVLVILLNHSFTDVAQAFAKWGWIPALAFAFVVPVICWALKKGGGYER